MEQHKVTINLSEYYGHPELYPYIPEVLYDILEEGSRREAVAVEIDADLYLEMMNGYLAAEKAKKEGK